jgi:hypothetical protein
VVGKRKGYRLACCAAAKDQDVILILACHDGVPGKSQKGRAI